MSSSFSGDTAPLGISLPGIDGAGGNVEKSGIGGTGGLLTGGAADGVFVDDISGGS